MIVVVPLLVSLPNLLIPLGKNLNIDLSDNLRPAINAYSYFIFQIIYCCFGYPTIIYQFFNPLRNLMPKILVFTVLPIVIMTFIIITYYILLINETGKNNSSTVYLAFLPIVGITLMLACLAVTYLFLSISRDVNSAVHVNDLYNSSYIGIYLRVVLFAILLYLCYSFCVQFTLFFSGLDDRVNTTVKSLTTYAFLAIIQLLKVTCSSCAQAIDARLSSSNKTYYCMYMISTIQVDIYIITFHRNLFTFLSRYITFQSFYITFQSY